MLRRINYHTAINLLVFMALWFLIGIVVLWTPLPDALGIQGGLFAMWLILFFFIMAIAGAALFFAAINAAFPPSATAPRPPAMPRAAQPATRAQRHQATRRPASRARSTPMWAPRPETNTPPESRRDG